MPVGRSCRSFSLVLLTAYLHTSSAFSFARHGPHIAPHHHAAAATRVALPVVARDILSVENEDEYQNLIDRAVATDRVVVIKFYASWCRACKAMAPKLQRVAEEFPQIEFHEVLFDNNKQLAKRLGIKILPYMEIVSGAEGKTDGFTCGPSKISMLQGKLQTLNEQFCN